MSASQIECIGRDEFDAAWLMPWNDQTDALIGAIEARGYRWGVSNGT